ncbi:uncharacterized protein BP01DRAFT_394423 [Aspergillus saccharolyticus JOP 1030-1]|uniref:Uncharacterized protein n=1 Tax=Aspergillus saccharolyticus JOP 1030-1 TaxID=1450539 RepID=A0A318Z4E9_9EURO|nr:hypothetical protein BP01DRAFT_394423 [Aspergillus saccharolyticus JOP 1030-1]PYH42195.1 hypothetical protein BP01DRAFT_394423 [Aspergillus saccharolyticus JOP 1030-1]
MSYLADVNLDLLEDSFILFCFGVLTTQALPFPRFHFNISKSRRWGVNLTMYGYTIVSSAIYATQEEVKSDICRAALKKLKVDFPDWKLPDESDDFKHLLTGTGLIFCKARIPVMAFQKICDVLHLGYPEFEWEDWTGEDRQPRKLYCWGLFKDDPFLQRAGAVGRMDGLQDSNATAEQACAKEVIGYLIRMVEEDVELKAHMANERRSVEQWPVKNEDVTMHNHKSFCILL